jgi:hypothetical protein
MSDDDNHEAAKARSREFHQARPKELVLEAELLPQKILEMNAKPMIRINPILDLADKFSRAAGPYVACKQGCSHCCHIEVGITGVEAMLLASKIGVQPAKVTPSKTKRTYGYNTPCTFLRNNECSIYEHRPFACRNHASFESSEDPCRLTDSDGNPRVGTVITPNFPGIRDALNVVFKLVGKTNYADIRDYFPAGTGR